MDLLNDKRSLSESFQLGQNAEGAQQGTARESEDHFEPFQQNQEKIVPNAATSDAASPHQSAADTCFSGPSGNMTHSGQNMAVPWLPAKQSPASFGLPQHRQPASMILQMPRKECPLSDARKHSLSYTVEGPPTRRSRHFVPTNRKDEYYWIKRRKNNEAARKSREKRRINDLMLEQKVLQLLQENLQLKKDLLAVKVKYNEIHPSQVQTIIDYMTEQEELPNLSALGKIDHNLGDVLLEIENLSQAKINEADEGETPPDSPDCIAGGGWQKYFCSDAALSSTQAGTRCSSKVISCTNQDTVSTMIVKDELSEVVSFPEQEEARMTHTSCTLANGVHDRVGLSSTLDCYSLNNPSNGSGEMRRDRFTSDPSVSHLRSWPFVGKSAAALDLTQFHSDTHAQHNRSDNESRQELQRIRNVTSCSNFLRKLGEIQMHTQFKEGIENLAIRSPTKNDDSSVKSVSDVDDMNKDVCYDLRKLVHASSDSARQQTQKAGVPVPRVVVSSPPPVEQDSSLLRTNGNASVHKMLEFHPSDKKACPFQHSGEKRDHCHVSMAEHKAPNNAMAEVVKMQTSTPSNNREMTDAVVSEFRKSSTESTVSDSSSGCESCGSLSPMPPAASEDAENPVHNVHRLPYKLRFKLHSALS